MDNKDNISEVKYRAKVIKDKPVAKTNPLDSSQDYHNVEEMAQDLGVEFADNMELSTSDRLKSRDKER
jgi:hypothetical protein